VSADGGQTKEGRLSSYGAVGVSPIASWRNIGDTSLRAGFNSQPSGHISSSSANFNNYDYTYPSPYLRNNYQINNYPIPYPIASHYFSANGVISTASCGGPVSVPNSLTPMRLYDYERRPPKSTELFDPKAPSDLLSRKQPSPSTNTLDMRNLNIGRTPLSPTTSSDKHLSMTKKMNNTNQPNNW